VFSHSWKGLAGHCVFKNNGNTRNVGPW
jgi:hypothetical protein